MKCIVLLGLCLLLTACSVVQFPETLKPNHAQRQFIEALDEFSQTTRVDRLKQLQIDYPNGVWSARAETIILYAQELDDRKREVETLGETKEKLATQISQLKATNRQLEEKLEQLKAVLIELEQLPQ